MHTWTSSRFRLRLRRRAYRRRRRRCPRRTPSGGPCPPGPQARRAARASAASSPPSPPCSQVLRGHQGGPAAFAEHQTARYRRHGAGLRRRLLVVLGVDIRRGLRAAAVRPRDGPRHTAAPRRHQGSRPMFIPFLGAAVMMKSMPDDALAEARVGLAGPVLGTLGAGICLAIAEATNSDLLRALAYVAFFLNLINLVPVVPFDGGRAMAAMAPAFWFVGLAALVVLFFIADNPFLLIFIILGFMETRRRWQARKTRRSSRPPTTASPPRSLARRRRLRRADRPAGPRHARGPHPQHRRPHLPLDLRRPAPPGRAPSAALRGPPVPCHAWSRARGSSGACRRGPCPGPGRSRPLRWLQRSRSASAPVSGPAR